jgi:Flp pilus assembly protein TadD
LAYNNLGAALSQQGELDEAVAAVRKADQLLPNHLVIRNSHSTTSPYVHRFVFDSPTRLS